MSKFISISFIKKSKDFIYIILFLLVNFLFDNVYSSFEILDKQNKILREQVESYKKIIFSKNLSDEEIKDQKFIQGYHDMELKLLEKRNLEVDIAILIFAILFSSYIINYILKRIELDKMENNVSVMLSNSIDLEDKKV